MQATTIRVHDDQENRRLGAKENASNQGLQQNKRAVLGVLSNNFVRSTKDICKEEKFSKTRSTYIPQVPQVQQVHSEPFSIFEDKKDEPTFQIYDDNAPPAPSAVVPDDDQENKRVEVPKPTEAKISSENEPAVQAHQPVAKSIADTYHRPVLQEIELDQHQNDLHKESPMSLDRSLVSISTGKKNDSRSKREACKVTRTNFYDIDEYRADIHQYFRTVELLHRPKAGYMKKQPDISHSMRTILVDWLVEVSEEYRLHTETLYLAVSYIDRFLSYMSVVRAKLQLVGTAAMFIAAKYEEIYPPEVGEFVYITDDTYTKKQVLRMEHLILRVLSFDLTVPTPLAFLMEYCISNNLSEKIQFLAMYLSELSLLEADPYLQFLPSHLAASAIALARHTLREEVWPHELELSTGYSLQELKTCISYLQNSFKNAPNLPQQAIQEKYKNKKYEHVALLLPRDTMPFEGDESESA